MAEQPSRDDLERRIDRLEQQGDSDRETIRSLELRAEVDRELIEQLQADGELDRAAIANLESALVSARRIGAAIGVLMASQRVTDDQAFRLLVRASQSRNRKLRDIAEDVVLTGILPKS